MSRQDSSFRIVKRVCESSEKQRPTAVSPDSTPTTHLKLNAPFKVKESKNEYPFKIENNYDRTFIRIVFPSCTEHEFRC